MPKKYRVLSIVFIFAAGRIIASDAFLWPTILVVRNGEGKTISKELKGGLK